MDRNTMNNIAVRLGELSLPRDRQELFAILEERVIEPLATSEGKPGDQVDADMLRLFLSQEDFARVAWDLRLYAENRFKRVIDTIWTSDPVTDDDAWQLCRLLKELVAHTKMLEVMAGRFDDLAGK